MDPLYWMRISRPQPRHSDVVGHSVNHHTGYDPEIRARNRTTDRCYSLTKIALLFQRKRELPGRPSPWTRQSHLGDNYLAASVRWVPATPPRVPVSSGKPSLNSSKGKANFPPVLGSKSWLGLSFVSTCTASTMVLPGLVHRGWYWYKAGHIRLSTDHKAPGRPPAARSSSSGKPVNRSMRSNQCFRLRRTRISWRTKSFNAP